MAQTFKLYAIPRPHITSDEMQEIDITDLELYIKDYGFLVKYPDGTSKGYTSRRYTPNFIRACIGEYININKL
jgi:hypothetical protein